MFKKHKLRINREKHMYGGVCCEEEEDKVRRIREN